VGRSSIVIAREAFAVREPTALSGKIAADMQAELDHLKVNLKP